MQEPTRMPRLSPRFALRRGLILLLFGIFPSAFAAGVTSTAQTTQTGVPSQLGFHMDPKDALRERIRQDREELKALLRVDSVAWQKSLWAQGPQADTAALARDRARSKQASLVSFCVTSRFSSLAELDSLPGMKPEDLDFCKNRLRTLNPSIPSLPEAP